MLNAGWFRRITSSRGCVALGAAIAVASATGCQRPALRALQAEAPPAPEKAGPTAEPLLSAEVPPVPPATPAGHTRAVDPDRQVRSASAGVSATPLLDAAIARAEIVEAPRHTEPEPPPPSATVELPEFADTPPDGPTEDPLPPALEPLPVAVAGAGSVPESAEPKPTPIDPESSSKSPALTWAGQLDVLKKLAEAESREARVDPELWLVRGGVID